MAEKDTKEKKDAAKEAPEEGAEKKEGEEGAEGAAPEGEEGASKPKSKKKKILIAVLAVLILGGGAGAAFVMSKTSKIEEEAMVDDTLKPQTTYMDLEEFLVNLNNPGRTVSFLKMQITLELPNLKTKQEIESKMPRIRDAFQVYLRELRSSDLRGSAGTQRLKEELLLRINKIIEPEKVNDILFKDIIVQ